jgi:hypothetical protein
MHVKRLCSIAVASAGLVAGGLGFAGAATATTPVASAAATPKIKKAEIRVRKSDSVRMKVKTTRGVDKVTFTYAGRKVSARRSHETPGEWQRTVARDPSTSALAFTVTACDGSDCVTRSYNGSGDRVRSGSDDSPSHDAGDDHGGRGRGSDDGANHS